MTEQKVSLKGCNQTVKQNKKKKSKCQWNAHKL